MNRVNYWTFPQEIEEPEVDSEYEAFIEGVKDLCKKYSKASGIQIDWRDFTDHEWLEDVEDDIRSYIAEWEH